MARSDYPKRFSAPANSGTWSIYGIIGAAAFAITFGVNWLFPSIGIIWLIVSTAEYLIRLIFVRRLVTFSTFVLGIIYAAVFLAAALH